MERHYLVAACFIRDILHIAMDVIHRVGHGRNVLLSRTGGGRVVDFVCHVCYVCWMKLECY